MKFISLKIIMIGRICVGTLIIYVLQDLVEAFVSFRIQQSTKIVYIITR